MNHCDKRAVTINPTNTCNLRCVYCMASSAEEQTKPLNIPIEFAKAGIKDAVDGYKTGTKADTLRFFSPGEPTQAMGIIRECINYARALKPDIKTELQTNGLFSTPEDTEWIKNNFTVVWFSLDGPPEINGKNRPDANGNDRTREIEKNMRIVSEKAAIGIRPTVREDMLNRQKDLVDYYGGFGVKNLALNPEIRQIKRMDVAKSDVSKNDIMKFAKGFLRAYQHAEHKHPEMCLSSSLTFNFDGKTDVACRSCLPMPQLNPDGSVSSCDMALYKDTKEALKCFLFGQWDKKANRIDYSDAKIEALKKRRLEHLPMCKNCKIKEFCAGGCAGRVAYQTGNMFGVLPEFCAAINYLANNMPLGAKKMQFTHP